MWPSSQGFFLIGLVLFSPLRDLVHFCQWFDLGDSSCLGFRLKSRREFSPYGCWLVWFLFSFSWVAVLLRALSLSQMIAKARPERWHSGPLEAGTVHLLSGQMQGCCPHWPDENPGLLIGQSAKLSLWPHEQVCPLFSWALIPVQKGWKYETGLMKCSCRSVWLCHFREVTAACSPVQAIWRQAQEDLETVAKNMNSFHRLGVRARHPGLASWLQSG